jgi:hypothetical protein
VFDSFCLPPFLLSPAGVLYYLLARMVLQMRGTVTPANPWDVMVSFASLCVLGDTSVLAAELCNWRNITACC